MKISLPAVLIITVFMSVLCTAQTSEDLRWDTRFSALALRLEPKNGVSSSSDSPVNCMVRVKGMLYVGGYFSGVGTNVAAWDLRNKEWQSLDDGVNGEVTAIVAHDNDIYVAGTFTRAGSILARNIARWNIAEKKWYALGVGVNGTLRSLCWYHDELYVAGGFDVVDTVACRSIARWNGQRWTSLGEFAENGVNGAVNALIESHGLLWVGGSFNSAGGDSTRARLAAWDGNTWIPTPGEICIANPSAWQYLVREFKSSDSLLCVIGSLGVTRVNDQPFDNDGVLLFNGHEWTVLKQLAPQYPQNMMRVDLDSQRLAVFAASPAATTSAVRVSVFERRTQKWTHFDTTDLTNDGYGTGVRASLFMDSVLIVTGPFKKAGSVPIARLSMLNLLTGQWQSMNSPSFGCDEAAGSARPPHVITVNDSLWCIGTMRTIGSRIVNGISLWNGQGWESYGSGFTDNLKGRRYQSTLLFSPSVNCMTRYRSKLIIGGDFDSVNNQKMNCIMSYDRDGATPLGGGIAGIGSGLYDLSVNALCVVDTSLYVGGLFAKTGGLTVNNIARWDGSSWHSLATGIQSLPSPVTPTVASIVSDEAGGIYVGGAFNTIGTVSCGSLAQWNSGTWSAVGYNSGDDDARVFALLKHGTDLYVAGSFSTRGGVIVNGIARWDGQQWHDLDGGLVSKGRINSMMIVGEQLYVGGAFQAIGRCVAYNIARWDMRNKRWLPLGSGTDDEVTNLARRGDTLFCSGPFYVAGKKQSLAIGAWHPRDNDVDVEWSDLTNNAHPNDRIYPNPCTDWLDITVESTPSARQTPSVLLILDEEGREVLRNTIQTNNTAQRVDVHALSRGLYHCFVLRNEQVVFQQLFIKL